MLLTKIKINFKNFIFNKNIILQLKAWCISEIKSLLRNNLTKHN